MHHLMVAWRNVLLSAVAGDKDIHPSAEACTDLSDGVYQSSHIDSEFV